MVGRLNIPDETPVVLQSSADAAEHGGVLAVAIKLFEVERLSAFAPARDVAPNASDLTNTRRSRSLSLRSAWPQ